MNLAELALLPDWPALMDQPTAILYLGGSKSALSELLEGGYLLRYDEGNRNVRYRREDIDVALKARAINGANPS